jgi:hypothetical protein
MAPIKDVVLGVVGNFVGVVKTTSFHCCCNENILRIYYFFPRSCLLSQNNFPTWFSQIIREKYLCHLRGKYKRFNHKWQPMSKIHYKESIIILYTSHISSVVHSFYPFTLKYNNKGTHWPIICLSKPLKNSHTLAASRVGRSNTNATPLS